MPKPNKQSIKNRTIGGIILALIIAFSVSSYGDNWSQTWQNRYPLYVNTNSAEGLRIGSKILLSGVPIGEVQNISLNPNNYNAQLLLGIDKHVTLPIGSSANIVTNGIFGEKYVRLTAGGFFENLQPNDSLFYVDNSLNFTDFLNSLITNAEQAQQSSQPSQPPQPSQ